MAYVPVTFVADEILTSTKMNQLGANDASFHDGTGISDGSIIPRHLSLNVIEKTLTLPTSMAASTYYNLTTFSVEEDGTYIVSAQARSSSNGANALAIYETGVTAVALAWVQSSGATSACMVAFCNIIKLEKGKNYDLRFRSTTATTASATPGDYHLKLMRLT